MRSLGTASAIEAAGAPESSRVTDNFVTGEPVGGAFCLSIIGGNRDGNGAAIEWDRDYAETRTARARLATSTTIMWMRGISLAAPQPFLALMRTPLGARLPTTGV